MPHPAQPITIHSGRGCVPVGALVFKISGRRRIVGCGGFDSHAFPLRNQTDVFKMGWASASAGG